MACRSKVKLFSEGFTDGMTLCFIVGGLLRTRLGIKDEISQCVSEIFDRGSSDGSIDGYIYLLGIGRYWGTLYGNRPGSELGISLGSNLGTDDGLSLGIYGGEIGI